MSNLQNLIERSTKNLDLTFQYVITCLYKLVKNAQIYIFFFWNLGTQLPNYIKIRQVFIISCLKDSELIPKVLIM